MCMTVNILLICILYGAVLAQKFYGALPPSALSSPSPFSLFSKTEQIRTSYRPTFEICHCQLCNGLDPETRRNEARRAESWGRVLGRGHQAPSPSARGSGGCKLPQRGPGGAPENWILEHFGTSEIMSEWSASF